MGAEVTGGTELRTLSYNAHAKYKGEIVPFADYLLSIQYNTGVIAEYMAVCTKYGLLDASYTGEIIYRGSGTQKSLNAILTSDYTVMADGQACYSPMCNEDGGMVDDLIMHKMRGNCYFVVANTTNRDRDPRRVKAHRFGDAEFEDISDRVAQLTLQGPKAVETLRKLVREEDTPEEYYTCLSNHMIRNTKCIISKTGCTDEDGVETYLAPEDTPTMWEMLMEAGREEGLIPCGLKARDTLRLKASMPSYGHEVDDTTSPKEAGSGIFIEMDKEDFIGKQVLVDKDPLTKRRIGLKVTGRGITKEYQAVHADGRQAGIITSGIHYPYLGYPVVMALVDVEYKGPGTVLEVEIRRRRMATEVVKLSLCKH